MGRILLLMGMISIVGCTPIYVQQIRSTSMKHHFDKAAMRDEILKYLSPGMPIENAKRIMTDSGFQFVTHEAKEAERLRFTRHHRQHPVFISDDIDVELYHRDGTLTEIGVKGWSVGP